jgi:protein involved in polysaccharide export with SLBB domain
MAGGVKFEANASETKIFRYRDKGPEKEILTVNVDAIQKGEQQDLFLKESDIVVVPTHGMKAFLKGFIDTVSGLIGFGFSLGSL